VRTVRGDCVRSAGDELREVGTNGSPLLTDAAQTPSPGASWLDAYLRHRRAWEIAICVVVCLGQGLANSVVALMDNQRRNLGFAPWQPVTWELSSALVILILIPAVWAFDRRHPLTSESWRRNVPWHLAASVVFSLTHVFGMVALRALVYRAAGRHYDPGAWPQVLSYEYLKDARTYLVILALIYLYRLLLLRLRGEARLLATPDSGPPVEPVERPERFLVRKLGKEFLVPAREIERLEAAENYVNLHVRGRCYPLRSTMSAIEKRLDPARFVRVHRSHIVNLEYLAEIEPLDTGDARLLLKDGARVPCSRRYRPALRRG
jgi:hypothetical protein